MGRKRQLNRMRVFAVLSILGLAAASDPFLQFAREHGRNYKSGAEVQLRREIFNENYKSMMEHNARFEAGVETWTRKVTPFYDHTMEEVAAMLTSGLPAYDNTTVFVDRADEAYLEKLAEVRTQSAPDSWSWVQQGGISSVKNQGQCGSCAAFATVAVIETCFWQQRGVMFDDLSEQHIVDCAINHYYHDSEGAWGAFGCDGAWPPAYMDWIVNNNYGKIQTETSYPYTASVGSCSPASNGDFPYGSVTGQYNLWNTNEGDMKELVYINPVTTSIQASWLSDYNGGIYNDDRCCEQATDSQCKYNLNHEVTIVGYGSEGGMDFWLAKNSWATWFGENGFFKIKRGTGHCGVGSLHYTSAYCAAA